MARTDRAATDVAAAPEAAYAAFVERDALEAWLPPEGMRGEIADADLRAGGGFTMTLRYLEPPEGGGKTTDDTDVTRVVIDEMVEGARVVWGVEFESDDPDASGRMLMTWTLTARGTGTHVVVEATDVPAVIDAEAHRRGLDATLANLVAHCGAPES